MLNYYITVCLLYNYLTFFGIVICSERNVLMSISPLQFSLMYNYLYHHWLTSVIHFISDMHFISRRHHINTYDVTNHTRSFYRMDHSLTDPLTTNYFFEHRQTVIARCMPLSVTYNNEFPYPMTHCLRKYHQKIMRKAENQPLLTLSLTPTI